MYAFFVYGMCFFVGFSFIEIERKLLFMSSFVALVIFLIYMSFYYYVILNVQSSQTICIKRSTKISSLFRRYFRKYQTSAISPSADLGDSHLLFKKLPIQKFLIETIKNVFLSAILVNAVIFYYFLDFGIIHNEYYWIVTLFVYSWIMVGWGISLFDFINSCFGKCES